MSKSDVCWELVCGLSKKGELIFGVVGDRVQ